MQPQSGEIPVAWRGPSRRPRSAALLQCQHVWSPLFFCCTVCSLENLQVFESMAITVLFGNLTPGSHAGIGHHACHFLSLSFIKSTTMLQC